jgi:hypothetical protein
MKTAKKQQPVANQEAPSTLKPDTGPLSRLYTTHQIGTMFQVDPSTVSKWMDKKLLVGFATPGGHRRVTGQNLVEFAKAHGMPVPEELVEKDAAE